MLCSGKPEGIRAMSPGTETSEAMNQTLFSLALTLGACHGDELK